MTRQCRLWLLFALTLSFIGVAVSSMDMNMDEMGAMAQPDTLPIFNFDCTYETIHKGKTYNYDLSLLSMLPAQRDWHATWSTTGRTLYLNVCRQVNYPCNRGLRRSSPWPAVCLTTDYGDLSLGSAAHAKMLPSVYGADTGVSIHYSHGDPCIDESGSQTFYSILVNWQCSTSIHNGYCSHLHRNSTCQFFLTCHSMCACSEQWLREQGHVATCMDKGWGDWSDLGHLFLGSLFFAYGVFVNSGWGIRPRSAREAPRRSAGCLSRLRSAIIDRGDPTGRRPLELAEALILGVGGFVFFVSQLCCAYDSEAGMMHTLVGLFMIVLGMWGLVFYYWGTLRSLSWNFVTPVGFLMVGIMILHHDQNGFLAAMLHQAFALACCLLGACRVLLSFVPRSHLLTGMSSMATGLLLFLSSNAPLTWLEFEYIWLAQAVFIVVAVVVFVTLLEVALLLCCCRRAPNNPTEYAWKRVAQSTEENDGDTSVAIPLD